ncbi:MAG TPA: hypothetical protein DEV85_08445 [Vibrio sp.]|uniref:sce7726 family protein n=1 Tax=Vibrio sp. TaxID=678 RepID=UPI000EED696E|nr:sce7726 family protein [Vibrio sp.]HCH01901.1 hypothetical protein [Vibrio sp.]
MIDSYDHEIREALYRKKLSTPHYRRPETLVVNELGLLHGSNRIDVAVLNGCIHGYEIKSSKDTLKRLNGQLKTYAATLQKLTFVIAPNHVDELMKSVPEWSGIIIATKGTKGAINFTTLRLPKKNPEFDVVSASYLLWKNEAQSLLKSKGFQPKDLNVCRKDLYDLIGKNLNAGEIVSSIKKALMSRENWRVDEQ